MTKSPTPTKPPAPANLNQPAPPVQPAAAAPALPPGAETADQALTRALNAAKLRRINEALGICRDVLAASPGLPGALGLMGGILGQEGRGPEAIPLLEAAIAGQGNVANWHLNLCALYRGQNRLDDALRAGREAVRLNPDTANPRVELALTHLTRGERDQAAKQFSEAIGREPENPAAHMGLGELLLSFGDYLPGWMEYAWRNKLDQARGTLPKMTAAPWNGMRIPDGKLLLVADQGFGDMIQFARYIPMARARVPHLIIGWGPEVTALLGGHPDIAQCVARWADVPPHDAYVLLSSLPQIFATTLDSIPWPGPYLTMDAGRMAHWRHRLDAACNRDASKPRRLRVGIAWAGRPTHPNNIRRSLRLEALAPILANRDIDFIALQKPVPEEDRAFAATCPNLHIIGEELESFAETGAVIAGLDLVLAVDTAIVHLAGAIGAEAWVLLPEPADWRWLLGREDSAWYPTVRLFRQDKATAWAPVLARAAAALAERVAQKAAETA